MNKLVYGVFKAIAVSMILVFVFDMAIYLYKAISLDQRMKNIMVSMQRTVAENNYLPPTAYDTYVTMIRTMANELEGRDGNPFVGTSTGGTNAIHLNYGAGDAWGIDTNVENAINQGNTKLIKKMDTKGEYGDIMVVQAAVLVRQPTWDFIGTGRGSQNFVNDSDSRITAVNTTTFTYTYYVPCMNYSKKLED